MIDEVRLVDRRWYQSEIIKLTETCYYSTYTSYSKQYETSYPCETINVTLASQKENYTSTDYERLFEMRSGKMRFVC